MPAPGVILAAAVIGIAIWGGAKVGHGIKVAAQKSSHAIVHVVTLGKK